MNTDIGHHEKTSMQKQLRHKSSPDYQPRLNIVSWDEDMLLPSGLEEESVSLPWFLTQQLSYSSDRSSRFEVESCWLLDGLLFSQIMSNKSTNSSVGLL